MEIVKDFEDVRRVAEGCVVGNILVEVNKGFNGNSYVGLFAIADNGVRPAYRVITIPTDIAHNYHISFETETPILEMPMGFISFLAERESSIGDWAKMQFNQ